MKAINILDHIFALRPMLQIPVWTITILGYYRFSDSAGIVLPLALVIGTGLASGVFLINQIYDIESDRINQKIHFLPKGFVKISTAWVMAIFLYLISLILAFYLSISVGFLALIIALSGIFYSVPPIALKNRSYTAVLTNAFGHGSLIFAFGYSVAGGEIFQGFYRSLPYFFAVGAVYIGTTLPDIEGDKKTGKITFGVIYGEKKGNLFILLCYFISLIAGLIVWDVPFLVAALVVSPFYIWLALTGKIKTTVLTVKLSIVSLSLAAAYFYPVYIVFLVVLILSMRAYYRHRFCFTYPSLK
jgi:geranylgeranylglycerol-phosphate geranylgeranyltransferase